MPGGRIKMGTYGKPVSGKPVKKKNPKKPKKK